MSFNLIVPAAIDKSEYEYKCPYIFSDELPIMQGLKGLDLTRFAKIYIVVLAKHCLLYDIADRLYKSVIWRQYADKFTLVMLDESTCSQPETVYKAIRQEGIQGGIMIKDADCFFTCDILQVNGVVVYPLDALTHVNPQNKSYVTIDDFFYITNIIEKKIIGRYFCVGGYCFEDVAIFIEYYEKLNKYAPYYVSFLIFSMLLDGELFRPVFAEGYQDWGTLEDWEYSKNSI